MIEIKYKINDKEGSITGKPGNNLLDELLDNGVKVPYSCYMGNCAVCRANLKEGTLEYDPYNFISLLDNEIDNGIVLTCQCEISEVDVYLDFDDI